MISKPHFMRFRMSEVSQFIKDILSILFKYPAQQAEAAEQVDALNSKGQELSAAHTAVQGSPLSKEIKAYDQRRDHALTGIRQFAESLTSHFKDNVSAAATLVLASIDKYGTNLAILNYEAETDVIANIVASWETDAKLIAAINTINLGEWINELKAANSAFNQKFLDRVQESALAPQVNALNLRKEAITNYRELVNNLEARATLSKTSEYVPLLNELNELVNKYNALVDARKSTDEEEATTTAATSTAKA